MNGLRWLIPLAVVAGVWGVVRTMPPSDPPPMTLPRPSAPTTVAFQADPNIPRALLVFDIQNTRTKVHVPLGAWYTGVDNEWKAHIPEDVVPLGDEFAIRSCVSGVDADNVLTTQCSPWSHPPLRHTRKDTP